MRSAEQREQQQQRRKLGGYIRTLKDEPEEDDDDEEEEVEDGEAQRHTERDLSEIPLTKTGQPDRRFLEARHLEPQEPINPDYRHPRQAEIDPVLKSHVSSLTGKPDRRFKENRALSDEEVMKRWAKVLSNRIQQQRH